MPRRWNPLLWQAARIMPIHLMGSSGEMTRKMSAVTVAVNREIGDVLINRSKTLNKDLLSAEFG